MNMKFLTVLIVFALVANAALALTPQYPGMTSADASYTVTFDGEGEAIVLGRILLMNSEDRPISTVRLEIPGGARIIGAMQRTGYGYERLSLDPEELSYSVIVPLRLEEPIGVDDQTEIIFIYKSGSYAKSWLGAFQYAFETPKLPYDTTSMRVGIDVEEGYTLRGTSTVNYQPSFGFAAAKAMESQDLAYFSESRVQYGTGQLTKSASYLDPHESFTVKGAYAKSGLRLYWGWTLVGAIVIGLVLFGAYKGIRSMQSTKRSAKATRKARTEDHDDVKEFRTESSFVLVPGLAGTITSIALFALWTGIILMLKLADSILRHEEVLAVVLVILGSLATLAALIGVPTYVGYRKGGLAAAATGVALIVTALLLAVPFAFLVELILRL